MSSERLLRLTCDGCGKTETMSDVGVRAGWSMLMRVRGDGHPVGEEDSTVNETHYCSDACLRVAVAE